MITAFRGLAIAGCASMLLLGTIAGASAENRNGRILPSREMTHNQAMMQQGMMRSPHMMRRHHMKRHHSMTRRRMM